MSVFDHGALVQAQAGERYEHPDSLVRIVQPLASLPPERDASFPIGAFHKSLALLDLT